METINKVYSRILINVKKNKYYSIIVLAFLTTTTLVIVSVIGRLVTTKTSPVYARVKLSQGLWWATTRKPNAWFINALHVGETDTDLLGKRAAEILKVTYYPIVLDAPRFGTEFNIYVTLKLWADKNTQSGGYIFNRATIAVGSPIELNFPSVEFTGTIMAISEEKPKDMLVEKNIVLTKKLAFPWEFNAIKVGDQQFNGEEVVFEVVSKRVFNTSILDLSPYGNENLGPGDPRRYITVNAKIMLKEKENQLVFGEELIVQPGTKVDIATPNFSYDGFVVQEIN